jgi:CBS domain-containing protein
MRRMSEIVKDQNPLVMSSRATVKHACELMRDRQMGAVLVTDRHGKLAGIFTGRDAVCRVLAEGKNSAETTGSAPLPDESRLARRLFARTRGRGYTRESRLP